MIAASELTELVHNAWKDIPKPPEVDMEFLAWGFGIETQIKVGLFSDVHTRAHSLHCLQDFGFWNKVIRPHLPQLNRQVLMVVVGYLAS